jgi:hypothetical protein
VTIPEIQQADKDGARFSVEGWRGIAFYFHAVETVPDEDTVWSGYEIPTGNVIMVMVGDDKSHSVDPEDVSTLPDGSYCLDCGQVGCGWHTND